MASIGAVRRAPQPAPAAPAPAPSGDWFDQQGVTQQPAPTNTTSPGGNVNQPTPMPVGGQAPSGGGMPFDPNVLHSILIKYPENNEGMRAAMAEADRTFTPGWGGVMEHARLDKIQLADGTVFDVMIGATGNSGSWVDRVTPEHGPTGGQRIDAGGRAIPMGGGSIGALTGMTGGSGGAMNGMDPSYGFIFDEGMRALQSSAAARGTLLTGPTLKAITQYGQGMASTEFGNIFDRNYRIANMGLNAAGQAGQLGSSYGGNAGQLAGGYGNAASNLITGGGNVEAAGQLGSANAWGNTIGNLSDIWGQYLANRRATPRAPTTQG